MPEIKRFYCWPSYLGGSTPIVGIDEFVKLIILLYMKSSNLSHSGTYLTKYLVRKVNPFIRTPTPCPPHASHNSLFLSDLLKIGFTKSVPLFLPVSLLR